MDSPVVVEGDPATGRVNLLLMAGVTGVRARRPRSFSEGGSADHDHGPPGQCPVELDEVFRLAAIRSARSIAERIEPGSARFRPAMSKAVPWSGLVRMIGRPRVTLTA